MQNQLLRLSLACAEATQAGTCFPAMTVWTQSTRRLQSPHMWLYTVWQTGTKVLEEHAPTTLRVEEVTLVSKMQAPGSSKMLISIYQAKRRHIPGDYNLTIHHHENLTSHKLHTVVTQWLTKLILLLEERNTFKPQHRHQLQCTHDPVHWNVDKNISNLDISCAAALYSF